MANTRRGSAREALEGENTLAAGRTGGEKDGERVLLDGRQRNNRRLTRRPLNTQDALRGRAESPPTLHLASGRGSSSQRTPCCSRAPRGDTTRLARRGEHQRAVRTLQTAYASPHSVSVDGEGGEAPRRGFEGKTNRGDPRRQTQLRVDRKISKGH